METVHIKGIASLSDQVVFDLKGDATLILSEAQKLRVVLKLWHQNENEIRLVCEESLAEPFAARLKATGVEIRNQKDCVLVSAVGDGLGSCPDLLPQFLSSLKEISVTPILVSRSGLTLTAAIAASDKEKAVKELHHRFVEVG